MSYGFIYIPLILLPDWKERKLGPNGSLCQSQFYPNPTGKESHSSTHCTGCQISPLPCKEEALFSPWFLNITAITYNRAQEQSFMRKTGHNKTATQLFFGFFGTNSLSFGQSCRHTMTGVCHTGVWWCWTKHLVCKDSSSIIRQKRSILMVLIWNYIA